MSFFDVPEFVVDSAVGNDKVVTVPVGETWKLLGVFVDFETDATVGVRQLRIHVRNPTTGILVIQEWGQTQIASLTKNYVATPDMREIDDITGLVAFKPLPQMRLLENFDIRVFDDNNISSLDTLIVTVNITKDTKQ